MIVVATADRRQRYADGMTDFEIAAAEGVPRQLICTWRAYHRLPANPNRALETILAKRREMHAAGMNDKDIGAAEGLGAHSITMWRRKAGLPRQLRMTPGEEASRMLLYKLGWSDTRISRQEHRAEGVIKRWRLLRGLQPNWDRGVRPMSLNDLSRRIRQATSRYLPRDIADDAAAELALSVLDGTTPIADIEKAARKFGNKAFAMFASKWGPRSLDEALGDTEDLRMIDMLPDERSSAWLEEMGATVW